MPPMVANHIATPKHQFGKHNKARERPDGSFFFSFSDARNNKSAFGGVGGGDEADAASELSNSVPLIAICET